MEAGITAVIWDILIVGAGPAGLAAAVNGRIRGKRVLLLGAEKGSERLKKAPEIRNYPGFSSVSGEELLERFLNHALDLGAVLETGRVENIYPGKEFSVVTRDNRVFRSRSVILATGVRQARLLPGEKELLGRGLGYCATCDGPLYRGKKVAVIGETPEAEQDVDFLAEICSAVYYFPAYKGEVRVDPRINVRRERPLAVVGEERVRGLSLADGELPVDGVFIIREVALAGQLVAGLQISEGAIVVGRSMETNIPGIFAAGDCTGKPYQVGKAVGEGLTAALSAVAYLDGRAGARG
ncbi:thioredoxin reductase TrxB [Thermacetogenium phaeum DSM 12270]|uniref:Thioredoxin reductase TrxB n=1 Tax=Thermacetogenium phaeum (strain ATCC BAA-254 / DSM 26808 / PB) TaxID=1089553 RepID=K4LJW1_THEPS|nr:FAD-dependent oxidoreductase [Thermacetogenium phaeum]AFV12245.1 thioredoxin reductase TrxB [Thermacetogenium phaeum DSM 12270]MDK2880389.1 thioredoxin reductase [Clostridia bacterium]